VTLPVSFTLLLITALIALIAPVRGVYHRLGNHADKIQRNNLGKYFPELSKCGEKVLRVTRGDKFLFK
jgi:hypothetical protein